LDQNQLNEVAADASIVGSNMYHDIGNLLESVIVSDQEVGDFAQDQIAQDQIISKFI